MKAAVVLEPGRVEWTDWPSPPLRPGHALVRIVRAGICSTDLAIFDGLHPPRRPLPTPAVLGHEAAGEVVEVAPDVTELRAGERVAVQVIWGRDHSRETMRQLEHLDPDWNQVGATALGGVFAELFAAPATRLIPLPDAVDWPDAALTEPTACALHAVEVLACTPGDTALVVGPGPFGLMIACALRAAGAGRVIVAGRAGHDERRLQLAGRVAADETLLSGADRGQVVAQVRELTDGHGADVTIEAGGTPDSLLTAIESAAPGATVAVIGYARSAELDPLQHIVRQGLRICGVIAAQRRHYHAALTSMATGVLTPSRLVTSVRPMSAIAAAMDGVRRGSDTKVALTPNNDQED